MHFFSEAYLRELLAGWPIRSPRRPNTVPWLQVAFMLPG